MKLNIFLLAAFIFSFAAYQSQNALAPITGNYIGQQVDDSFTTIKIKKNHQYILKVYDQNGKFQKKVKGSWALDGPQLTLKEKSGIMTVLQNYNHVLYIPSESNYTAKVKYYAIEGSRKSYFKNRGC